MSLLSIVTNACDRLSLARPAAVIASSDQTIRQMLGLAQQEGKDLSRVGSWQALTTEQTFLTVATAAQTSSIPADFDWYIDETMFNRTSRRFVTGPLLAEHWQRIQASLITQVNPAFRIRGNTILITPTPAAGNTIAYEYISKNWCASSLGVPQSVWTADTDTAVLDEELHTLGLLWRWKKAKGLDYAEEFATYQLQVAQALQRDGGKPRISTDNMSIERVPTSPQVPETYVL